MRNIVLNDNKLSFTHDAYKADVDSYSIDATPLADDNGAVTAATITVNTGNITASTPSVSSSVISFDITQTDVNDASFVLKVTFTNGQIRNVLFKINALLNDLDVGGDY